jgi:biopolymer transport protein ExbB
MRKIVTVMCVVLGGAAQTARAGDAASGGTLTGGSLAEFFLRGGPLMWPILLCSVVAATFVVERFWGLRPRAILPQALSERVLTLVRAGRIDEAIACCDRHPSPFARMLRTCLDRADAGGFEMEAALEEAGSRELYDLRRNARPLGVVADVAPLLGLMGTVIGMIKAFEVVAHSGGLGRTELLAEGIGEALITTAFGLAVAVPSVIAYHYFRARADGFVRTMEDECLDIVSALRRNRRAP